MIKSAADKRTARFLGGEPVREFQAFERQAQRRVAILNEATCIEDLMRQPSNHFEALGGDRKGQFSIRINMKWRLCFTFSEGDAYDVEIVDYH
jgi:toxin HigB-1